MTKAGGTYNYLIILDSPIPENIVGIFNKSGNDKQRKSTFYETNIFDGFSKRL